MLTECLTPSVFCVFAVFVASVLDYALQRACGLRVDIDVRSNSGCRNSTCRILSNGHYRTKRVSQRSRSATVPIELMPA